MNPAEMSSVLELPVGQIVYPFAGARRFQRCNLTKVWDVGDWGKVLSRPTRFNGISGALELLAHRISVEDYPVDIPLGRPRVVIGYNKSGLVEVTELPLSLMTSFQPRFLYQYRFLEDYMARVYLGQKSYLMPCRPDNLDPSEVQMRFDNGESVDLFDLQMFDDGGNRRYVHLPYKLGLIRTLGLIITKKPQDFDGEEVLPVPRPPLALVA